VGQIDARREQPAAAIFGVLDDIAAQHGDFGRRIERGNVDRDLQSVECRLIFGIEKPRIAHRYHGGFAATFEDCARQFEF
jgi:hypothetical protein